MQTNATVFFCPQLCIQQKEQTFYYKKVLIIKSKKVVV